MSTPTAEKRGKLGSELGLGMVDIVVGPMKVGFRVHKDLLCSRAPVFDRMFNGSFKEAGDQKAELPEDSVAAFDLFIEWIYTTRVPALVDEADEVLSYIKLYCFAEKYCLSDLSDYVMTTIMVGLRAANVLPDCEEIFYGYQNTAEGSPMRQFMVAVLQYLVSNKWCEDGWESGEIADLLAGSREILFDYVEASRASKRVEIADPVDRDPCDFHVHAKVGVCSAKRASLANE